MNLSELVATLSYPNIFKSNPLRGRMTEAVVKRQEVTRED